MDEPRATRLVEAVLFAALAGAPLAHFAICLDQNGDVVVDANKTVTANTRF